MTHDGVKALTKKDRSIIFRLYLAFIWRFLVWSLVLKVIAFLIIETVLFVTLTSIVLGQGIFLTDCWLGVLFYSFGGLLPNFGKLDVSGYHSGRYKLQVQSTS